uniref:Uncharacterized protein n=1 Tax=Panagrolaimus sp. ES5 TaxID=591445 RepID=A0AC34GU86_9BILA
MDESVDTIQEILSPEDAFKEIIGNLKEYTSQGLEDVMVNKTRILRFLKTYHPVKIDNYVFGLSENLRTDKRLIVFEWNDRKRVREYTKKPGKNNHWVCRECFRQYERGVVKIQHYLFLYSGIVLVHNTAICKPISYELVMQYQKFLAEGNVKLAQSMIHSVSFLYEKCNFANIVNVLDTLSTKRKEVNGNENNSKVFCETIDVEMKEVEPVSIQTTSIFAFEKPSTSMLKEICAKLKIEYSSRAEKMWDQIMFKRIDTVTPPKQILIHHLKTQNFYQILSKFFIGKTKQHKQIKAALIDAFREKLISSGEASSKKFDKLYSDTVTAEHLSFIAKYLSCRILIFEGAEMRKYGNWKNTSSKRATLVVALIDGFYSIVLDF